jgi:hypothetical protein
MGFSSDATRWRLRIFDTLFLGLAMFSSPSTFFCQRFAFNPSKAAHRSSVAGLAGFCSIPGHASSQTGYVGKVSIILSLASAVKSTSC